MTIRLFTLLLTLLSVSFCFATASPKKGFEIQHIAPPSWWTGMKNSNLQIMIHAENVAAAEISIESDLAELRVVNRVEIPNYVFLDVVIAKQGKGSFDIDFRFKNKKFSHTYKLHDRIFASDKIQGLDPSDLIYLIMPDRFANGDQNNDIIPTMQETTINRDSIYWRHGLSLIHI